MLTETESLCGAVTMSDDFITLLGTIRSPKEAV